MTDQDIMHRIVSITELLSLSSVKSRQKQPRSSTKRLLFVKFIYLKPNRIMGSCPQYCRTINLMLVHDRECF
jgi:hypothetical protein